MIKQRYFQNFKDIKSLQSEFEISEAEIADREVLFAWYGYGSYCGTAEVLFKRGKKLFEVSAGHCSCNGIEGQWKPHEVTWEQLAMREDNYKYDSEYDGGPEAYTALQELIHKHVPRA